MQVRHCVGPESTATKKTWAWLSSREAALAGQVEEANTHANHGQTCRDVQDSRWSLAFRLKNAFWILSQTSWNSSTFSSSGINYFTLTSLLNSNISSFRGLPHYSTLCSGVGGPYLQTSSPGCELLCLPVARTSASH